MAAWTRVIDSLENVPADYKYFFEERNIAGQSFPFTLFAPSLVKSKGKTTEKMVCDMDDAIHILERKDGQVIAKSYPYQDVCMLEMGSILLSSWLTVSGITDTGAADTSTIDFNTSGFRYYELFLKKLRPSLEDVREGQSRAEQGKFDYLSTLNFKLMNYGRNSLIGGETVRQVILQPEIKKPVWAMLGDLFQKLVTPPHLTVLTSHELILIEDVGRGRKAHESQYGGIWQYIPLQSIQSADWSETGDDCLTLSLTVTPHQTIEKIFSVGTQTELRQCCVQLQETIGGNQDFA
ncbi:MAG: hypothetical protein HY869_16420 [Chloroflexi bacterium]|nr:hypothetical protein [Chloroflexota bacterium]